MSRRASDEAGFTVVELAISLAVFTVAMAALYSVLTGFLKTVDQQAQLAESIRDTRPAVADLVVRLRQALPPTTATDATPVGQIGWDRITFYSDRLPQDGAPERYQYLLTGCAANVCSLQQSITQPDSASAPDYSYSGTPDTGIVLTQVNATSAQPLFSGRTPSTGTTATACVAGTASPCNFPVVKIDLHRIAGRNAASWAPHQITEEVRLRNVVL